jgi:hypothetical protein
MHCTLANSRKVSPFTHAISSSGLSLSKKNSVADLHPSLLNSNLADAIVDAASKPSVAIGISSKFAEIFLKTSEGAGFMHDTVLANLLSVWHAIAADRE